MSAPSLSRLACRSSGHGVLNNIAAKSLQCAYRNEICAPMSRGILAGNLFDARQLHACKTSATLPLHAYKTSATLPLHACKSSATLPLHADDMLSVTVPSLNKFSLRQSNRSFTTSSMSEYSASAAEDGRRDRGDAAAAEDARREASTSIEAVGEDHLILVENSSEHPAPPTRLKLHHIWLRDHCRCSQCFNAATNQRSLEIDDVRLDIKPKSVQIKTKEEDGRGLFICFFCV